MRIKLFLFLAVCGLFSEFSSAQVLITEAVPTVTVNFSASMQTTVGSNPSTPFSGAGFTPTAMTAGRLNSNAWSVLGFNFGDLLFGGTQTVDDFGRGSVSGAVLTPGIYAYTDSPATVANPTLLIQPGDVDDFNPGSITLRVKNNGTTNMTQLQLSYNIFLRNDEGRSSTFNFSHSLNSTGPFQAEPSVDFTSPDVADAFQWVQVDVTPSRSIVISGINVAPGAFYYLRWSSQDVAGTGDRDEFGLDDIVITGTYGAPAPEINVLSVNGTTILSMDSSPSVAKSTDFAPMGAPVSTYNTSVQKTFSIQNLGGAILNISNVTITGANASNFTIYISGSQTPTGNIAAVSGSVVSIRDLVIIFDPSFTGLHTARVNIASNDNTGNENPYWFDIQGYGFDPKPDIEVKGLTGGASNIQSGNMIATTFNNTLWADQVVGTSVIKDYRIKNTGQTGAPLLLTGTPIVTVSGINPSDFVVTTQPTATSLNAGFGTNYYITFTPSAPGIRTALITIANNDLIPDPFTMNPESPFTYLVQGKGISPEIDVLGNSQSITSGSTLPVLANYTFFDYLNVVGASLTRTYTIKNTGTAALSVGALTISGANASDFTVVTLPAASVAANAATTFSIKFDPSATGVRNATVNLVNNDFDENPYTFSIRGYGIDYIPCSYLAVETIAQQDFEAAPATPVWLLSSTTNSVITGGNAFGATGDSGASPKFLGARSLQVNNSTSVNVFAPINTTAFNDITLSVRLASLSTTAVEGSDANDKIVLAISTNGGTNWSDEFEIKGNTNAKWNFTSGTGIANGFYDGDNIVSSISIANGGFVTADGISTLQISNLPKSPTLSLRITIINNNAQEIWAIDNVSLTGRKELSTTWAGGWSNGLPNANTKAIINGPYDTSNGNIQACKLQVNATGSILINSGQYIIVESDLANAGVITIENGGSLVQKNDYATNSGSIIVKRNTTPIRKFDYTYWSSPVSGMTLFNLSPLTLSDKYFQFNTASNVFQSVPSSTVMSPGKGYIVRGPQNFDPVTPAIYNAQFSGPTNNGFIQQPILNVTGTWNLLGNPYPSAINANTFLQLPGNTSVVGGTIYLWTHNTPLTNNIYAQNDYASYNLLGGTGTAAAANSGVNTTIPTGMIASGQGFFTVATAAGQATFTNSMRVVGNNLAFFRQSNQSSSVLDEPVEYEKSRFWLNLSGEQGLFRQILIGYANGATNGEDRDFDGKQFSVNSNLSFYSLLNNSAMTIQGRALPFDDQDVVMLGFTTSIPGIFELSIENFDGLFIDQEIFVKDNLLNVIHNLKSGNYSFETDAGTFDSRFEIHYINNTLSTKDFESKNFQIAVKDQVIKIRSGSSLISAVRVIDQLGRVLYDKKEIKQSELSIETLTVAQQVLIVQTTLQNGTVETRKIIY